MQRFLQNPELFLEVAQHANHETIQSLLKVKAFRGLMQSYMKAILKESHAKYVLPPDYGGSPGLLGYEYVLISFSTWTHLPILQPVYEWKSLKILEAREREIEFLLDSSWLRLGPATGPAGIPWPKLDPGPKAKFRALLKKGLYLCDTIRDMEAKAVVELGCPSRAHAFHPARWPYEEPAAPGSPRDFFCRPGMVHETDTDMVEGTMKRVIPQKTRNLQKKFLGVAPVDDLVAIYMVQRIVGESWLEKCIPFGVEHGVDNLVPFYLNVLQELLMRHGSWYLYDEFRGDAAMGARLLQARRETAEELREMELEPDGADRMLLIVMCYELSRRLGVQPHELADEVATIVEQMIGAERPAFNDPPSWQIQP
ncbi:hypothetical protein ACRE_079150 [Hapsidospora chrysogenum ATCC 11550]|uniref:Uncharacterized protein n=1 Tax=Hapsidospora chrysogenum (strain ATCC 11550 / CBS 779.69 / DSM 880 / IAM 14645 / JCM 23072 / IMI 49137) TaxID=857340 RepID=A0A086SW79_HAPC1|nr:hypothetical protein ACRE_079150 [Hapsidospora chrysogenum ATCC 11550]